VHRVVTQQFDVLGSGPEVAFRTDDQHAAGNQRGVPRLTTAGEIEAVLERARRGAETVPLLARPCATGPEL
jgi:hypothetical protein